MVREENEHAAIPVLGELKLLDNDARQEKSKTLAIRAWEIFGFGTQYAWLFSVMFGASFFLFSQDVEWAKTVKGCFAVGFAVVYMAFFFLKNAIDFASMGRVSVVFFGAIGTLGTILVAFPGTGALGVAVSCVAALLVGISQAALMALGNRAWSKMRPERVMVHLSASAFVACILYYCLAFLPPAFSVAAVCALPVVGSVILSTTRKEGVRTKPLRALDLGDKRLYGKILLFVAAFSFPMGVAVGGALRNTADAFAFDCGVLLSGALAVALFAFVLALRAAPTEMLKVLAGIGVPLILVGCVCILAFSEKGFLAGEAFVVAGFVASDLFMWFLNAELVSRSGRLSIEVLARSCCVEWLSFFAGFALSCGFLCDVSSFADGGRTLYAASAVLLIVVASFVLTQVDLVRIIEAREGVRDRLRTEDACRAIAKRCGLSPRESEVMAYLANGRSVPYIQEKLTLSQSTVKTHVRNVYRKTGVDGKQDLLDMVERESL